MHVGDPGGDLLSKDLVHLEHIDFINTKNCLHLRVTHNFTLVVWVLKFVALDTHP